MLNIIYKAIKKNLRNLYTTELNGAKLLNIFGDVRKFVLNIGHIRNPSLKK